MIERKFEKIHTFLWEYDFETMKNFDFFKIFCEKIFILTINFQLFEKRTHFENLIFYVKKKHFFDEKIFFLKEKKRGKNWIFFLDFLSMIQFIIWKKSLNFRRKWVFKITVGREFLGILRYESFCLMKRAIDWIKIMKSKCSIMIKIITSKVDLYLFLQRL